MADNDIGLDPEIERLSDKWARDPTSLVFAPLADAYRRSNLVDEAIQVLEKGLKNHPNYTSARIVLGKCYKDKRMFELAREEFRKVLSFDPHNLVALRLMGDVSLAMGQKDAAAEAYSELLQLQPTNVEIREALENMQIEAGQVHAEPVRSEPEKTEEPSGVESEPAAGFADYFGTPAGLAGTENGSAIGVEGRELASSFEPHSVLSEAEPVADLEGHAGPTSEVSPPSPEEKAPTFAEFLEPQPVPPDEPVVEEPTPALPEADEEEKPFVTSTLAEIYERQGFKDKALEIYRQILEAEPDNTQLRAKIEELSGELPPEPPAKEIPTESGEEVALTDLLAHDTPEEAAAPPTAPAAPAPERKDKEERPAPETADKMDLQSFQSWLKGLKGG